MKNAAKTIFFSLLAISLVLTARQVFAQVTVPHPYVDFSGIFLSFEPICENGAIVKVKTPSVLVLLLPKKPITKIAPVFKLWGPIAGATTLGNYRLGGFCEIKTKAGKIVKIPVTGTLVQIGTSLIPTSFNVLNGL